MNIERAVVISVCTWIFCVVLAAAAQSIAEDSPQNTAGYKCGGQSDKREITI
jgi:hypothetical protein